MKVESRNGHLTDYWVNGVHFKPVPTDKFIKDCMDTIYRYKKKIVDCEKMRYYASLNPVDKQDAIYKQLYEDYCGYHDSIARLLFRIKETESQRADYEHALKMVRDGITDD